MKTKLTNMVRKIKERKNRNAKLNRGRYKWDLNFCFQAPESFVLSPELFASF